MNFTYIIEKIKNAEIIEHPFPHLDIQNLLLEEHLNLIINDTQIHFQKMNTNDDLHEELIKNGWKIQNFPGCVDDWKSYIEYLNKKKKYITNSPVEMVGITFRLSFYKNDIIKESKTIISPIAYFIKQNIKVCPKVPKNMVDRVLFERAKYLDLENYISKECKLK